MAKKSGITQDELYKMLLEKVGMTEQELMKDIYKDRILELARKGSTIGEMLEVADAEGFHDALLSLKFTEIMPHKTRTTTTTGGTRLTKNDVEKLQEAIQTHLKKNPGSSIGELVEATGYDAGKVRPQLAKLKEAGLIETSGTKRDTVYTLRQG
jgi:DNA-binding transcriptional ArsR family regulator